jgi:hypothetical protein
MVAAGLAAPALADPMLADFSYSWPVEHYSFESQRERMEMAYLDVRPEHSNGRTAVLLHGKNFCAGTGKPRSGPCRRPVTG